MELHSNTVKLNTNSTITHSMCSIIPPSTQTKSHSAIVDSGCISHYFPPGLPLTNVHKTDNGINVTLPDSSTIKATHIANLPLPT